jgi:hypothetical protein
MRWVVLALAAACASHGPVAHPVGNTPDGVAMSGARTVRDVDWRNRKYGDYVVKDGETSWDHGDGDTGWFVVSPPIYGDVDGDGFEDAIIISTENTGGTGRFDGADVYTLRDGAVVVIASIPGGDRGHGGLEAVTVPAPKVVTVRRYDAQDGVGACCPSRLRVETWRWEGGALVQDETAVQLEPIEL